VLTILITITQSTTFKDGILFLYVSKLYSRCNVGVTLVSTLKPIAEFQELVAARELLGILTLLDLAVVMVRMSGTTAMSIE
jgi:hypothetical protein